MEKIITEGTKIYLALEPIPMQASVAQSSTPSSSAAGDTASAQVNTSKLFSLIRTYCADKIRLDLHPPR